MTYEKDISQRIVSDFGDNASEAFRILDEAILKTDYLAHPRTIRCIIFLSNKDLNKLKSIIKTATGDPRDVMLTAEYSAQGQGTSIKRGSRSPSVLLPAISAKELFV
ncbi:MAG: hypothetical protein WD824_02735 [Cyclobacteriaceae bacterium]